MATCQTLLDDLNDSLADSTDTKYTEAQKIRYLNRGQAAMFPKVHRLVRDTSIQLIADQFNYTMSATLNEGQILGFEVETEAASNRYVQLDGRQFDYLPGGTGQMILTLKGAALPAEAGADIRITAALPLTPFVLTTDTYTGPAITEELPVLYAMGLATERDIEARLRYTRFSTTQALNGTEIEDFQTSAEFWFNQFARRLDQVAMPLMTP